MSETTERKIGDSGAGEESKIPDHTMSRLTGSRRTWPKLSYPETRGELGQESMPWERKGDREVNKMSQHKACKLETLTRELRVQS